MTSKELLSEICMKYEEHLEGAGEDKPRLLISILSNLLYKERETTIYLKRLLERAEEWNRAHKNG